jgi:ADP-ribosylglycohydrolase/predicted enzyme related to lactoylglutathione lyase
MANKHQGIILNSAVGAILGAACGDALGWPNERVRRPYFEKDKSKGPLSEFQKWTRRSGGRYYPHKETIDAGTYSDDTQLILCITRSLLHGQQWWDRFCHIELPFWALYERGGGGATKRAADAWINGFPPWSEKRKQNDVKRYFDAGGNGVAMRILPHILFKADNDTFAPVARNILLDGIATHGHPRALVGALCYGYALWRSIRRTDQLKFGEVIDDLLHNLKDWATSPEPNAAPAEWLHVADKQIPDYQGLWMDAVNELTTYLGICREGISKGSLTLDDDVLRSLNCYDRKINGAGTVAAAAAVYFASRYAPEPMNGVTKAAYAIGTDTDTIASMTGGLLGTISGIEWLSCLEAGVQDSEYLKVMAKALATKSTISGTADIPRHAIKWQLNKFKDGLLNVSPGKSFELPDGRFGEKVLVNETIGKNGKFKVFLYRIAIDDGQSIEVSKIVKGSFADKQPPESTKSIAPTTRSLNFGIKLPTRKLNKAEWFYKDILGLEIKEKTSEIITFEQGLVLVPDYFYPKSQYGGSDTHAVVYTEVADIEGCFSRVKDGGIKIVTSLSLWGSTKRSYFRCSDPDGNIIEVFSTAGV